MVPRSAQPPRLLHYYLCIFLLPLYSLPVLKQSFVDIDAGAEAFSGTNANTIGPDSMESGESPYTAASYSPAGISSTGLRCQLCTLKRIKRSVDTIPGIKCCKAERLFGISGVQHSGSLKPLALTVKSSDISIPFQVDACSSSEIALPAYARH